MRHAIVAGAGIGGLSAAIALATNGWSVDVHERGPSVREFGAGIFIKGNGLRVLDALGVLDQIRRDCVILKEARTFDKDGQCLARRPLYEHNPVWTIQRQLLVRALCDRTTELGGRVHVDSQVEVIGPEGDVRIGGQRLRADLVVAADGVNSSARYALGLDRPVGSPRSGAIRLLIPRTGSEADDVVREFWSSHLRVGIAPCTPRDVFVYLIAPLDEKSGTATPIDVEFWSERFPKLASEELFERAKNSLCVHHAYPLVHTTSWVSGRVALIGDAAHALPPTLGQGAGLSLTNALLMSHYVSERREIPEALAAWQRDWRWITDRTQRWSRRYDRITSEWPQALYPVRNAVIWAIGRSPRFNSYMRVADRVDAPRSRVLPVASAAARKTSSEPSIGSRQEREKR
jgi:2-polyprenyl-6-methoxyphenol hydroxylase-like FAD-dependent oxidoreductase